MNSSKVHYLHFREEITVKEKLGKGNSKISTKGGATVAFVVDSTSNLVKFALAKCHNRDNFNRRLGRTIATNRLQLFLNNQKIEKIEREIGELHLEGLAELSPKDVDKAITEYIAEEYLIQE